MADLAWIGWLIAFASLVAGFIYFRANRKVKRVEWWIDSDQDLINLPGSDIAEDITVAIDGDVLQHPRAVQLTIKNTGNVGLKTETMHRPFEVVCEGKQELCSAYVTRTIAKQNRTESLPYILAVRGQSLEIPSTLLNASDYVTCQLLINGPKSHLEVLGEAEDLDIKSRPNRDAVERRLTTPEQRFILRFLAVTIALLAIFGDLSSVLG